MTFKQTLTTEEFIKKVSKIHNNKFDYSITIYNGVKNKIELICPVHGKIKQLAASHLKGRDCFDCSYFNREKLNTNKFIIKAKLIHGDKFNYSKVSYEAGDKNITIICSKHGDVDITAHNHLLGASCRYCYKETFGNTEMFIIDASKIHNNKYDYSKVIYVKNNENVIITCLINNHGDFPQTPNTHLKGRGCPKCGNVYKSTTNEFIEKLKLIHGNRYDYSKVIYTKATEKIEVICKIHNSFFPHAYAHLNGSNCPTCVHCISQSEIDWLNYLNISEEYRHANIKINNKHYRLDAFDPITNTIYEFYGDFWHGNPKVFDQHKINNVTKTTFGELYLKTIKKENELKEAGYNIISIWGSDWDNIKENTWVKNGI